MKQLFKDTVKVNIDDIIPDPNNPNKMTKEQAKSLIYSMKKFDDVMPIVVDSKSMIIADGHHRLEAYKSMGVKEIEVIKKDFKNATERILFAQTMNKLRGEHDKKLDVDVVYALVNGSEENLLEYMRLVAIEDEAKVLAYLQKQYPDYTMGYNEAKDLDDLSEIEAVITRDMDMDTELQAVTKQGDLIRLGDHLLLCGDANSIRDINKILDGRGRANLMLTDPPYGIDVVKLDRSSDGGSKPVTIMGRVGPSHVVEANLYRRVANDDKPFDPTHLFKLAEHQIIFGGNYFCDKLPMSPGWLVWYKRHEDWERVTFAECELIWTSFEIPARVYPVTWMGLIKEGEHGRRVHPTQKPVKLLMNILADFSKKGDIILDPYMGSGSTLIACEQTSRKCQGIELDPLYCDVIIRRWEKLTGKTAERITPQDA